MNEPIAIHDMIEAQPTTILILDDESSATSPANRQFLIPPLLSMMEIEREAILQTLARTSGNVKKSAEILRIPRPTFYRKLKKLGIKVDRPHGSL